jgi:hypothetical protein
VQGQLGPDALRVPEVLAHALRASVGVRAADSTRRAWEVYVAILRDVCDGRLDVAACERRVDRTHRLDFSIDLPWGAVKPGFHAAHVQEDATQLG